MVFFTVHICRMDFSHVRPSLVRSLYNYFPCHRQINILLIHHNLNDSSSECQPFSIECGFLFINLLQWIYKGDDILLKMSKWILTVILLFSLFYEIPSASAETKTVIVDTKSLQVRSGPGLTYSVIGSLKKGESINVTAISGDWFQIAFGNQSGWVASWLTTSTTTDTTDNTTIVARVNGLNVRSGPSIDSAVLDRMNAGEKAILTERDGEWAAIVVNGTEGWVHTDYISEATERAIPTANEKAPTLDSFTVSVNTLNVRKKADLSSKRVGLIHKGETYAVKEIDGNWVRIVVDKKQEGWVYSFHGTLSTQKKQTTEKSATKTVTILSNGTNIREAATTSSQTVSRADAGVKLAIIGEEGDWYKVSLPSDKTAFVAKWVVSTDDEVTAKPAKKPKTARVPGTLKGLTLVVDAGHGGNDRGTTGARGTDEKGITLLTAELLAAKLKAAGANVIMTRESDTFVSLRKRVAISQQHQADAFISVHYDANLDTSITGFTTYYTHSSQQALATAVNKGLASTVNLRNRGAQPADFLVLRENKQDAILIELGFLSNVTEERAITTEMFREQAAHGIYKGLLKYFNAN